MIYSKYVNAEDVRPHLKWNAKQEAIRGSVFGLSECLCSAVSVVLGAHPVSQ